MRILLFLVGISIHLQGRTKHTYLEVVLRRQTEGRFLEDPEAHGDEMMGQVSKLGGSWRCAATRTLTISLVEIRSLLEPRQHKS